MKAPQVLYLAHQLIWIDQFNPSRNLRLSRVMTYQSTSGTSGTTCNGSNNTFFWRL
jgi:hypothetical protein